MGRLGTGPLLVGQIGLGPHLVDQIGSGVRVIDSFHILSCAVVRAVLRVCSHILGTPQMIEVDWLGSVVWVIVLLRLS